MLLSANNSNNSSKRNAAKRHAWPIIPAAVEVIVFGLSLRANSQRDRLWKLDPRKTRSLSLPHGDMPRQPSTY